LRLSECAIVAKPEIAWMFRVFTMFRDVIPLCFFFAVVPFALVLGAAFLRLSVSLANRFLGANPNESNPEDDELDEWIGYRQIKRPMSVVGIPELTIGKGMVSLLLMAVVNLLAYILFQIIFRVGIVNEQDHGSSGRAWLFYLLISTFLAIPLTGWLLSRMISTSFGRGCLVLLIFYLLLFMIFAGMFVFISLLFF
jgi:hypothetical protein